MADIYSAQHFTIPKARFPLPGLLWLVLAGLYVFTSLRSLLWMYDESNNPAGALPITLIGFAGLATTVWRFGWPERALPILAQALIGVCAFFTVLTFPILQQLSAAFALLGLYGFFAGFARVSPALWRKGFILAGLVALALPFALVPGTGAGFYLRLLTADTAAQILAIFGHTSLGAHDVLIFDNGIAQVDIPCSGLKSLFTGTAFFLVASMILRRTVSVGWVFAYGVFIILMLIANIVRVTMLIWISEIMEMRDLAERIHMPLGLALFCTVCVAGVYMLLKARPYQVDIEPEAPVWRAAQASIFVLLVALAGLAFAQPDPPAPMNAKLTPFAGLDIAAIPLTKTERDFFAARDQTRAAKWMFRTGKLSGSMLVVRSRAANGLHAPEVCMLGNGVSVQSMTSKALGADMSYRWLTVDEARRNAVYWMQSGDIITDDFRVRLSKYVIGGYRDWTMVTLLFDQRHNVDTPDVQSLMAKLRKHYMLQTREQE